ncbi:uncharacterized protein EV420DRAFT_1725081 [Desarmillaria tabescens]|uniref:Histone H1 n=1 Tax=Armillaria tabescens TaxID=1929756 RepID=A0AA39TV90_ARMTA|nr:uncharacterized protein EV420DRAFT_1725081 [Desarmillaria tabescens]KAK0464429.1 hypothetical protein EV420DRAFT_1725081 [Desarmillaria tabescens]
MQATAAVSFFPSLPHPPAADHDIKRRYLALLPPQQIIEICLTLEFHVPLYVKSSVWPADINAAIATIEGRPSSNGTPESDAKKDDPPLMDSLVPTEDEELPEKEQQEPEEKSEDESPSTEESKPPEKQGSPTPVPVSKPATTTTAVTSAVSPSPKPAATVVPTPTVRPTAYPHQPYGYHAYPHASYYPQHAWPYPHLPYPPPPPAQVPSPYHPPPVAAAFSHTSYQNTPPPPSSEPTQPTSEDNLPSYEDMIVEALVDANDPDGIAPKDVYAWMAAHYPVQANFRPSASQALQKAYRRGRFEKSSSGKYRLNPEYKGNNTISRRPTRRPQTVNSAPAANSSSQPRSSPFTHAPLIKNGTKGAAIPQRTPYPAGYPAPFTPPVANGVAAASTVDASAGDIGDAYAAAQHILKTINFGEGLLTLSKKSQDTTTPVTSAAAPADQAMTINDEDDDDREWEAGIRAQLQAQLALLAAQLAEYTQESHQGDSGVDTGQHLPPPSDTAMPVDDDEDDDDEDMDEVIIP